MHDGYVFEENRPLSRTEQVVQACEGVTSNQINHQFKEEYILRDKYFPYIESFIPKTDKLLLRHIAQYEDKHSAIVNSPYPIKILPFGRNEKGEDYDIVYRCCNIDPEELRTDIKRVPLPNNLTEKAAFLPFQVTLFLIIRYYLITKQIEKYKILSAYYGYSIYWKRYNRSFPHAPSKEVIVYTINDMSYRNLIKKLGSLKKLLEYSVQSKFEYYREGVANACDEDIRYILDQIQSDIGSKVNNIAQAFYANNDKKNQIFTGNALLDNMGTQREDNSVMASVQSLAQKYTNKFFMENPNIIRIKRSIALDKKTSAKAIEIEETLDYVKHNATPEQMHEFYTCLFYLYLSMDDPRVSIDNISSLMFLALMKNTIIKGNSNDRNIIKIREYMDDWLNHGSKTFRLSTREGTLIGYRKVIFFYFILSVTEN